MSGCGRCVGSFNHSLKSSSAFSKQSIWPKWQAKLRTVARNWLVKEKRKLTFNRQWQKTIDFFLLLIQIIAWFPSNSICLICDQVPGISLEHKTKLNLIRFQSKVCTHFEFRIMLCGRQQRADLLQFQCSNIPWNMTIFFGQVTCEIKCNGILNLRRFGQTERIVEQIGTIRYREICVIFRKCRAQAIPNIDWIIDQIVTDLIFVEFYPFNCFGNFDRNCGYRKRIDRNYFYNSRVFEWSLHLLSPHAGRISVEHHWVDRWLHKSMGSTNDNWEKKRNNSIIDFQ